MSDIELNNIHHTQLMDKSRAKVASAAELTSAAHIHTSSR